MQCIPSGRARSSIHQSKGMMLPCNKEMLVWPTTLNTLVCCHGMQLLTWHRRTLQPCWQLQKATEAQLLQASIPAAGRLSQSWHAGACRHWATVKIPCFMTRHLRGKHGSLLLALAPLRHLHLPCHLNLAHVCNLYCAALAPDRLSWHCTEQTACIAPAGTNANESLAALAYALGKRAISVEAASLAAAEPHQQQRLLARKLAGVCQTGTWLCICDADKLDPETLGNLHQQLATVQIALQVRHQLTLGTMISLMHQCQHSIVLSQQIKSDKAMMHPATRASQG